MLLSDCLDRYRADRLAKGFAPSTVRSQQGTLRQLLADIGNIHVSSITPRHMDVYFARRPDTAPATFNKNRAHLMAFFKWCATRGYMPRTSDPLEGLRKQRKVIKDRIHIPQSEFESVLDAAPTPRDRMIVAFGLYLFTRIGETCQIRWGDCNFDRKLVTVQRPKTRMVEDLPMCSELEDELRRWRFEYAAQAGQAPRPGWFVTPAYSAPRITGRTASGSLAQIPPRILPTKSFSDGSQRVKRVLAAYGYEDLAGEGGHTLRRSGATALYQEMSQRGHDRAIRLCQAMLGHSSIQTTEIYLRLDLDKKARNDILAGKPMFTSGSGGTVIELSERARSGTENSGGV